MIHLESYKDFNYNPTTDKTRTEDRNKQESMITWIRNHPLNVDGLEEINFISYYKTEKGYAFNAEFNSIQGYYVAISTPIELSYENMRLPNMSEEEEEEFKSWLHKAMIYLGAPPQFIEKALERVSIFLNIPNKRKKNR